MTGKSNRPARVETAGRHVWCGLTSRRSQCAVALAVRYRGWMSFGRAWLSSECSAQPSAPRLRAIGQILRWLRTFGVCSLAVPSFGRIRSDAAPGAVAPVPGRCPQNRATLLCAEGSPTSIATPPLSIADGLAACLALAGLPHPRAASVQAAPARRPILALGRHTIAPVPFRLAVVSLGAQCGRSSPGMAGVPLSAFRLETFWRLW